MPEWIKASECKPLTDMTVCVTNMISAMPITEAYYRKNIDCFIWNKPGTYENLALDVTHWQEVNK